MGLIFSYIQPLHLLIGQFISSTFKVIIDRQGLTHDILLFCGSFVVPLFPSPSFAAFFRELMIFCTALLWSPSLYLLCIYWRFLLCGYHDSYIKHLIDKTVYFKLIETSWSWYKTWAHVSWPITGPTWEPGFTCAHLEPEFAGADGEPGAVGTSQAWGSWSVSGWAGSLDFLESTGSLGSQELPVAGEAGRCQSEPEAWVCGGLVGAWFAEVTWGHGSHLGSLEPASTWMSQVPGFTGVHWKLPRAPGVSLVSEH